jgi:hypothetical protein
MPSAHPLLSLALLPLFDLNLTARRSPCLPFHQFFRISSRFAEQSNWRCRRRVVGAGQASGVQFQVSGLPSRAVTASPRNPKRSSWDGIRRYGLSFSESSPDHSPIHDTDSFLLLLAIRRLVERRAQMIRIENKKYYRGVGVYIGRPSLLGNPFKIGKDGTRQEVIRKYGVWLWEQIKRRGEVYRELKRLAAIARQGDLVLICWCKERDKSVDCHGDLVKRSIEWLNSKADQ